MRFKLVSFDLQGTLSEHGFSTEVWLELLSQRFDTFREREGESAYSSLILEFKSTTEDSPKYYDIEYWLRRAGSSESTLDLCIEAKRRPYLFPEMISLVQELSQATTVIVTSATTQDFIQYELGKAVGLFKGVFSTYDDFSSPGKPPAIFKRLSSQFGVADEECLHVGDHKVMDGENPLLAGWSSVYAPSSQDPEERARSVLDIFND